VRVRLSPIGQLPGDKIDHLLDVARGCLAYLPRLPWHLGGEGGDQTAIFCALDVRLREIAPQQRAQRLSRRHRRRDPRRNRGALGAGPVGRLDEHRLARGEVRVEAAVREPGFLHDVCDAGAVVAAAPDRPRGGGNDTFVGGVLAAGSGSWHGEEGYMMSIIMRRKGERKFRIVLGLGGDSE
jgi:hypothetical protein